MALAGLASGPVSAQTLTAPIDRLPPPPAAVRRAVSMPNAPSIGEAVRRAARDHAAAMTQSAASQSGASGRECAKRVVQFTLAGAAIGGGSMLALLVAKGGSDYARELLTGWTLVGAGAGAVIGAIMCAT